MNPQEVWMKLQIMDLAKQWPEFQALHDMARTDLLEANAEAKAELDDRVKVKAEKEAESRTKAQEENRRANEQSSAPPQRTPIGTTVRPDFGAQRPIEPAPAPIERRPA